MAYVKTKISDYQLFIAKGSETFGSSFNFNFVFMALCLKDINLYITLSHIELARASRRVGWWQIYIARRPLLFCIACAIGSQ